MEFPIYTVPDLTIIVRDKVPLKVRFRFSHEFIIEMILFSIVRTVRLCTLFPPNRF